MTTRAQWLACSSATLRSTCHHDTLAGRESVVLHDVRRTELIERGGSLSGVGTDARRGGRNVGGRHHFLGERLAPFELGGCGRVVRSSAMPARLNASATPATKGTSGPMTTRSAPSLVS